MWTAWLLDWWHGLYPYVLVKCFLAQGLLVKRSTPNPLATFPDGKCDRQWLEARISLMGIQSQCQTCQQANKLSWYLLSRFCSQGRVPLYEVWREGACWDERIWKALRVHIYLRVLHGTEPPEQTWSRDELPRLPSRFCETPDNHRWWNLQENLQQCVALGRSTRMEAGDVPTWFDARLVLRYSTWFDSQLTCWFCGIWVLGRWERATSLSLTQIQYWHASSFSSREDQFVLLGKQIFFPQFMNYKLDPGWSFCYRIEFPKAVVLYPFLGFATLHSRPFCIRAVKRANQWPLQIGWFQNGMDNVQHCSTIAVANWTGSKLDG